MVRCIKCREETNEPYSVTRRASSLTGPYCPECGYDVAVKGAYSRGHPHHLMDRAATGRHNKDFSRGESDIIGISRDPYAGVFEQMRRRGELRPYKERG